MSLKPIPLKIIQNRYCQPGEETWEDLVERVYTAVFSVDQGAPDEIKNKSKKLLLERKFLFNTPTWINAGVPGDRTLSACFVGELKDSMTEKGGILDCSRWFGTVQKFGGGTGIDLSAIRPKGSKIKSTHGKSCGPIAVLKYLAATSQMITQGGVRDGANMAVMSVYHPDIMDFIHLKSKESKFMLEIPREYAQDKIDSGEWTKEYAEEYLEYCKSNGLYQLFNVSVAVDEKFMKAVKSNDTIGGCTGPAGEILPCGKQIGQVWEAIVKQAWASGDPGLLFLERAQEYAKLHSPFIPTATNPCGEQYLPSHGSCNLGSIDLSKFIYLDLSNGKNKFDLDELKEAIHLSVRMLDNIVTLNKHPVSEIAELNIKERRVGLGVMGWADSLILLGYQYDSDEAVELADSIAKFFAEEAWQSSVALAQEKGPFPLWDQVISPSIDWSLVSPEYRIPSKRRNATVTTVAPTGTISIVAGCSSGIEPHFNYGYRHDGMAAQGGLGYIWASDTIENLCAGKEDPEGFLRLSNWKPANEIDIKWHIAHQAAWQKWIDNSISKTLNLPNHVTVKDISDTYIQAWLKGCKGSTVYRDGCKPFQVLNVAPGPANEPTGASKSSVEPANDTLEIGARYNGKRPEITPGVTIKIKTNDGSLYVTVNRGVRDEPFELFATVGKAGGKAHAYTEAIGRLVSLALQYNIPVAEIMRMLRGISAGDPVGFGPNRVLSVPDGIGIALEKFMNYENGVTGIDKYEEVVENKEVNKEEVLIDVCPQCKSALVKAGDCIGGLCYSCGYSKCG